MERRVTKKKYKQYIWIFGGMRTTWARKKKKKETDRKGQGYLLSNYWEPSTLTCPILSKP